MTENTENYDRGETAAKGAALVVSGMLTSLINPFSVPMVVVGLANLGYAALVSGEKK